MAVDNFSLILSAGEQGVHLDWTTWVTILLAAIGVLIAALGVLFTIASVILGALAVFGFRDLKSSVIAQAGEAAKTAAEKAVQDVISRYPTPAEMTEQIYARVTPQVTEKFASKFDIQASAEVTSNQDRPPKPLDLGALAETYPEELQLPPDDVPPAVDQKASNHD
jgi:hypothetical protein